MACVNPDGKPTESGRKMLEAAKEPSTPEEVSSLTNLPLFKVRSGLRDLKGAGYLKEEQGKYITTSEGIKVLKE